MDQWVINKLTEWDLKKWETAFKDEEVSEESFKCLTQSMIEKLIPKTGPQAVFLKRWNSEFRKSNNSELSGAESSSSQKEIDVKTKSQVVTIETCDPIINLEDTLKRSVLGIAVLNHFRQHQSLSMKTRSLLADAILHVEMRTDTSMLVRTQRFEDLRDMIIKMFPREDQKDWYSPSFSNKRENKHVPCSVLGGKNELMLKQCNFFWRNSPRREIRSK
ncbi:uncharacterized protein LOC122849129 isoform X2 [Aphidius gifuensis]|uniref:uncharacterized protein LOC122849129 isoform X2 n=2 Tax=Aphidius gifuensis TaxID=684658 RepID=UPI001CDBB845|nr:uncharacterized protein LOC122849129 isoform X2 [Aphidius gifuensis]